MKYYKLNLKEIYSNLNSSEEGLTNIIARSNLEKQGLNEIEVKSNISAFKIFISQFKSFIIYILIFAVIISLLIHEYIDAIIIILILILNSVIGFFQEFNAEKSLDALKKLVTVNSKVYRDNNLIELDSKYLVIGDIIFLEAGDKVPADCRIIEASKLKVIESSLTGESLPVSKISTPILKEVNISDQKNMLFSSTTISEGSVKAIIVATAMDTEIGKITKLITSVEKIQTPLQKKLDSFGKKIAILVILISIFVFTLAFIQEYLKNGFTTKALLDVAMVSISLAVAAVPTALPAVVTIALAIGVKRLLKKKALVRNLSSVETLGSCNIICTDKTGTLTKNEMTVRSGWTINNKFSFGGVGYNPQGEIKGKINNLLLEIGLICNNASLFKKENLWQISGDPTEAALIVSAKKAKISNKTKRIDELPFDSDRKLMSVLIKDNLDKKYIYTKGATDNILKKSTHILINGKPEKLTKEYKKLIQKQNDLYSSKALRVLSFAYKKTKINKLDFSDENNLIFVGLQAMIDPPRPEVIESIKKTKKAGIRVIMITGDYKETAKAIGKEIGIEGEVLTGEEIDFLDEINLERRLLNNTNIFARVIPEHKQKIVKLLQKNNFIVAMTGDGVNDAPALKAADIGIAVGSGTDVAKEASDFILLEDSFSNIVDAIEEGRGIYDNIQKSIMLLLSGNIGEVLIIFLAVIFGMNLPLTAILLLWINLITDGAPALAFSVDPYSKSIMNKKPKKQNTSILPKKNLFLISYLGIIGSVIGLILFRYFEIVNLVLAQTIIFNFIVLYELLLVFIIREEFGVNFFSNLWLWGSIFFSVVLQLIILYTPLNLKFKIIPLLEINQIMILFLGGILFILSYLIFRFFSKLFKNFFKN